MKKVFVLIFLLFGIDKNLFAQTKNILMFVSHEQTYYSEYIVMLKALQSNGYTVDVRSSSADSAGVYFHYSNNLENAANEMVAESGYSLFENQFENSFGMQWNADWNIVPLTSRIPVNGMIQDVNSISNYDAFVVVGGTGVIEYKYDGFYQSQGIGNRLLSSLDVGITAMKLNQLAIEALVNGKPVLAQCHGASLPVYWRVPNTSGVGVESLGISLLKDNYATGFPEPETADTLNLFGVNFRVNDRVTVSSPNNLLNDNDMGDYKLITTRDWYPQTVAYAARTLLNILETYPTKSQMEKNVSVLILHGGELDINNCNYTNRVNDVPCNYGNGFNLPADYTDVLDLLQSNSNNDNYGFSVNQSNISDLNFPTNEIDIITYLNNYDVIVFFKHWSTNVTPALQNAILEFVDIGGGIVGIHHAMYNDVDGELNKDILANNLFGAESRSATWSANRYNYNLYSTNYGHFVSTYGLNLLNSNQALPSPYQWNSNPLLVSTNISFSYYNNFGIYDEIYHNMEFTAGQVFGRSVNEITPLFSNDIDPAAQAHTSGFVKLFNPSLDESIGRVAYFQIIRNSIIWANNGKRLIDTSLPVELLSFEGISTNAGIELVWKTKSELNNGLYILERKETAQKNYAIINKINGHGSKSTESIYNYLDSNAEKGKTYQYQLSSYSLNGKKELYPLITVSIDKPNQSILLQNYPSPFNPTTSIPYQVSENSIIRIEVINSLGQLVKVLKDEIHVPGQFIVEWDGTNSQNVSQASGVYFVRLMSNDKMGIKKLLLKK